MNISTGVTEYLASFVPALIRKRISMNPEPISAPEAEEYPAVVMFADISGFSSLTERLGEQGPAGVEALAHILNDYFGRLLDLIYEYGGDVVKFAGDALIAIWPIPEDNPPREWTLRAVECACRIREQMIDYQAADTLLSLKLAISTGRVWQSLVGGIYNRWEMLIAGEPLAEIGTANHLARPGDIIACPSAWSLIQDACQGGPLDFAGLGAAARLEQQKTSSALPQAFPPVMLSDAARPALLPFIPGSIISRISAGQSEWLAELRRVTIMFINLPDLGGDSSLENSQELVQMIQRVVYRYEGSLNKISEDDKGIIIDAAFGLPPLAHQDDPFRGLQAAMRLRAELQERGLHGSIGITTGRVFCGLVGNKVRREYTFFGNSVNLAARFVGLAAERAGGHGGLGVVCDQPTYEGARERVEFQALGPRQIKGRRDLLETFEPLRENKGMLGAPTGLVGRKAERELLIDAIQEIQRGLPFQALILHGEAGIGKSRLMEELIREAGFSGFRVLSGEADGIEKNNSYFAWRGVFNRIFGIEEILASPQLDEDAQARIQEAVHLKLTGIDPALARYLPLMDVILPITIPENDLTAAMTSETRGGNIRDLLVQLLQHEAARGPLLVTLEDLHWLDSASWILLADVFQKVRPLLLAVDTRPLSPPVPGQFKELSERSDTKFIRLDRLGLEEVEQLVCQRLRIRSLPPRAARLIREKSEGHPFFAEELAYALRDSGILEIQGAESSLAHGRENLEAVVLPDTLEAAITSRIDGLNPSQQLTLKVASVIGRLFAFRMLEAIHPIRDDQTHLPDYMDALTRLNLTLVESEAPDLAYIFKHAVTQEVAYNLMLFAQRRQLHQSAAEWIEANHQQNIQSYYTLLAHHWTQAARSASKNPEKEQAVAKAVEFLEKAGDQSLINFANLEALEFFRQALDLVDTSRMDRLKLGQWYRKISDAYLGLGRLGDSREYLLKALASQGLPLPSTNPGLVAAVLQQTVRQVGHRLRPSPYRPRPLTGPEIERRQELVHLAYELSVLQFLNGDPNPLPMMFSVLAGLNTAESMSDSPELWGMYAAMSALMGFVPLPSEYRHYRSRWIELGKKFDHPGLFVDGAMSLCAVASGNGEWQVVKDLVAKAAAICEEMGDHRRAAEAVAFVAVNTLLEGGPKMAEPYNRREWEVAMRRENPIHIAFAYQVDCSAMVWKGDLDGCIENSQKCLALSEKTWVGDIPEYIVRSAMWLAMWLKGEREEVWPAVRAGLEKFSKASVVDFSAYLIHSHLAEVAFLALEAVRVQGLSKTRLDETEKYARLAVKNLKKFVGVFSIGSPALARYTGELEWHHKRPARALLAWEKAAVKAGAFPMSYEAGRAELLLGQRGSSEPERRSHLRAAAELFEASGYENWARAARQSLPS